MKQNVNVSTQPYGVHSLDDAKRSDSKRCLIQGLGINEQGIKNPLGHGRIKEGRKCLGFEAFYSKLNTLRWELEDLEKDNYKLHANMKR